MHTYLSLINLGASALAHSLMAEKMEQFLSTTVSARQKKMRESELHELLSLSTPEQLETNSLAASIRSERTSVQMTSQGLNLLLNYLRQNDAMLLLGIINERMAIQVKSEGKIELKETLGKGRQKEDVTIINQSQVDTRLLSESIFQKYERESALEEERRVEALLQDESITKKQRIDVQRKIAAAKSNREEVEKRAMQSQIPLPSLDDQIQEAMLTDLKISKTAGANGQPVGKDSLPSAAYITFLNAKQSLSCASLNPGGTHVAAGFVDSSIRICRLGALQEREEDALGQPNARNMNILRGHSGSVTAVDFSSDEKYVVSSSLDGTVRLWSLELSSLLVSYTGHMLPVWDVSFAPEFGYYFASSGGDRTARLWATERSQPLRIFCGHQGDVDVVRWHPNCHYIATGSSDSTVRLWDIRNGECVRILAGHQSSITSIAFSSDGVSLATGDAGGSLATWDLRNAKRQANVFAHSGPIWSLAYCYGEGKLLASGGNDCLLQLWGEEGDGNLHCASTWTTKASPVIFNAFTRRNLLVAAGPLRLGNN